MRPARIGGRFRRLTGRITGGTEPTGGDAWEAIQLARHSDRPYPLDYVARLMPDFEELHGDRLQGDDHAIVAGVGRYRDLPVALIGQQKGRDARDRAFRNFGMPGPEGYRKGVRVMALAEKLRIPLITLIDTPGAFPGAAAEEHGQGGAIARSMQTMMRLRVPTIAVVIGEGSSGGALALGIADRVVMLENATYSVISPEGASAILWRDAGKARLAAAAFKPTAANCYRWGVADAVVPEPPGGAHRDHDEAARLLDGYLSRTLRALDAMTPAERIRQRRERFRRLGAHRELPGAAALLSSGAGEDALR
ncbi:MAG TPA: acetyl-CoA carboxylase carboxyltransferase subunit alpha [Miltoncostaeaceae bacterium]|nr:acetyl-CoA carboxylase carboxyltransferase subunit alpha [Miltoncostaeaceae bacterium]